MSDEFTQNYAELIAERIAKRDGKPLPNGTLAHAGMLMEAMFRRASKSIRILTGELNARVYGTPEVIDCARQFLANSDHELEIVFEGNFDDGEAIRHPLLVAVGRGSNVHLYRLKADLRKQVNSHFAIMDEDSYRFEADKMKPSAVAAFGDKAFTKTLATIFENMKARGCEPMRLLEPTS